MIDGVGEDVVRRPNAGVLSARLIPAFAEVHIYAYFTPFSPLVSCICVYPVVVELFSRIIAISSAEISIRSPGKKIRSTEQKMVPFFAPTFGLF